MSQRKWTLFIATLGILLHILGGYSAVALDIEELLGEDDDDDFNILDLDDDSSEDDLEEYSFDSPTAVHNAWRSALDDLKEQSKEMNEELHLKVREMQKKVSNKEMTKEEMKEQREALEKEAEERTGIPMACHHGRQSCLHAKNSPLKDRAVTEAKAHMTYREKHQRSALRAALLPSLAMPDVQIGSLPEPPSNIDKDEVARLSKAAADDPDAFAVLSPQMQSYVSSVAVVKDMQNGAIVNTGALPFNITQWEDLAQESRDRKDKRTHGRDEIDVAWRIATEMQEKHAKQNITSGNKSLSAYPTAIDLELQEWFEGKGGQILNANVQQDSVRKGHRRVLVTENTVLANETVLRIPFRLTLNKITMRNVGLGCKGGCSFLKEHFGPIFEKKEEWGLAVLLLHEHAKGNESRWYPFMRSLRMYMLSKRILKEMKGTFAMTLYRLWDEEAEAALWWVNEELCNKHTGKACNFGKTRKEFRWALGVVRSFAFNLTKRTSGKSFLSLVPFGNYLSHRRGVGGEAVLELDNTIRLKVGSEVASGHTLYFDRGTLGDSETMLRYFRTSDDDNPDNFVRLMLPGAQGERDDLSSFFFRKWKSTMELWRRQMHYPPKLSDLWRMAKELNLYGYEDDEDEEKFLRASDKPEHQQLLNSLPMSTEEATVEEQMMLMGYVKDEAAASLILTGQAHAPKPAMLYTAPELDENPHAENAIQDMADAALQLQEAIAAGHSDPAVLTVIDQTIAFFENGTAPVKGLDEIDRLLMRKRHMLKACGSAESHRINAYAFSDALLCAVRVTVMNESDVDILCPRATGPWHDHNCDDGIFDPSRAISPQNERAMITALRNSIKVLLEEAPHSVEEDESLLELTSLKPALRSAVLLRLREKQLLARALKNTDDLETELDKLEIMAEEEDQREQERLQRQLQSVSHDDILTEGIATSKTDDEYDMSNDDDSHDVVDDMEFDEDWDFLEEVGSSESEQALKKAKIKEEASTIHYFQLWVRERDREAMERRRLERERYFELVQMEEANRSSQVVAYVSLNISNEIQELTVYRGDDLSAKVQQFFSDNVLSREAMPIVEKKLRVAARKTGATSLLMAVPVILDDGRLRVLAVFANDSDAQFDISDADHIAENVNMTQIVRKAFARWNVSLDMENYEHREEIFVDRMTVLLNDHLRRKIIIQLPLDAPDGRKLILEVRQGQQHDLETTVRCFVEAVGLSLNSIRQIIGAIEQRLPQALVQLPVAIPNRRKISLSVAHDTVPSIREEVAQFCRWNQLPDMNVPNLVRAALKGVNPNSFQL